MHKETKRLKTAYKRVLSLAAHTGAEVGTFKTWVKTQKSGASWLLRKRRKRT